jgi:hypothetical protein
MHGNRIAFIEAGRASDFYKLFEGDPRSGKTSTEIGCGSIRVFIPLTGNLNKEAKPSHVSSDLQSRLYLVNAGERLGRLLR